MLPKNKLLINHTTLLLEWHLARFHLQNTVDLGIRIGINHPKVLLKYEPKEISSLTQSKNC